MARKKLSEWKAKSLVFSALGERYIGISVQLDNPSHDLFTRLDKERTYVVKIDEGIKKRMKKGLVALNKTPQKVPHELEKLHEKGYTHALIEPFLKHEQSAENYLSIERVREGLLVLFSEKGGIDIEDNQDTIKRFIIPYTATDEVWEKACAEFRLEGAFLTKLIDVFDTYYFSFLEINPLVKADGKYYLLDVAAEVDSAGSFFVDDAWTEDDFRTGDKKHKTDEEGEVTLLSQKSQASFTLNVLNPDGSVFVLLSGGGASIVLADEVYNLGLGKQLANYGEYSGNPNAEEVYLYTKAIISLLLKSTSPKKVLLIGGGVANFTDVRVTFGGLIKALQEFHTELQERDVKVYVRRGGPHQQEGLAMMEQFLKENNLYGYVGDQTTELPDIVAKAVAALR